MTRIDDFWQDLGELPPAALAGPREELLAAGRVVAAAASRLDSAGPDRRLEYLPEASALVTGPCSGARPVRLGLSLCALEILVLDGEGAFVDAMALGGRTPAEAADWLGVAVGAALGREVRLGRAEELELPAGMIASGGAFSSDPSGAVRELGRYFADTHLLLEAVAADTRGAGRISVAVDTLEMRLDIDIEEGVDEASISAGLCPGSEHYDEPYWFVLPSPLAEVDRPPVIAEPGHWHGKGWRGTAMTSTELFERVGEQPRVVDGYFRRSLTLCRGLLRA